MVVLWLAISVHGQDGRRADLRAISSLPSKETRWALIIGVDSYGKDISPLYGSVNDAKALKEILIKHAGFPEPQVILMTTDTTDVDLLPNRGNILDALDRLSRQVPENGLLLFSFSGHGISIGSDAFLIPSDGRIYQNANLMRERSIDVLRVKQAIQATKVRQVLMFLDACRNEPEKSKGDTANPLTEAYKNGFSFDRRNREVDAFATIYATSIGERAFEFYDSETKQHRGFFSYAIVEGLRGAAASEKGEVTLGGLIKYLESTVSQRVYVGKNQRQIPYSMTEGFRPDELVLALATKIEPNSISPRVSSYLRWLELLDNRKSAEVVQEVNAELTQNPANALALRARAAAYYTLSETAKAKKDAEVVVRVLASANSVEELEARCYAHWQLDQRDQAIADCTRALNLDARNKWAFLYRGGAYYSKDEEDRAIADYTRALEIDPHFVPALKQRGSTYSYKKEYARALADFTRAIDIDPKDVESYWRRGNAHAREKKYDRAVSDYSKAIEL